MSDIDTLFASLARPALSPLCDHDRPAAAKFSNLVRVAPIVRDGSGWQFHPRGDDAPLGAWRWIVAVRDGCPITPHGWTDMAHHCGNAMCEPIVDLAALSIDFRRSLGTLYGVVDVIGTPQEPGWNDALRLRRDPLAWMTGCMHGVALLRPVADCAAYLRGFSEIITDDLRHGQVIEAALRRAYAGPTIRVPEPAQAGRAA